jgi:ribosomal protein S21
MKDSNKKKFYKKVTKEDMEVYGKPSVVRVVNNQIEPALKLWKRKLKDSGKLELLKARKEYVKPSAKKRKRKQQACRLSKRKRMFDN